MKILMIIDTVGNGGAERVTVNLANAFVKKGIDVALAYMSPGSYIQHVHPKVTMVNLRIKHSRQLIFHLQDIIASSKPDILFSTLPHITFWIAVWKVINKSSKPFVARSSNTPTEQFRKKSIPNTVLRYSYKYIYNVPDIVIAQCEDMKNDIVKNFGLPEKKVRVIYNPVDIEFIKSQMKKFDPYDHSLINIVTSGRLEYQKGFDVLLKAFKLVLNEIPNAKLTILGQGTLKDKLEKLASQLEIRDSIDMRGWQDNPFPYYYYADLFVLSSRYEGFPNVVLEAMACGTKIVSTNCKSGPREIIGEKEEYGWLAPVDNPERLAEKIIEAINSENRTKLRSLVFSIDKISNDYLSMFNELL